MKRAEKIKAKAEEIINQGNKPSANTISKELEIPSSDVHRCLNHLEKQKEIETYKKQILGTKHRMISVKR